jgi:hypothetical protein
MWHVFRNTFAWHLPPQIHHDLSIIHHAKHHVLRTQFPQNPLKNDESPPRKKSEPQFKACK